MQQKKVGPTQKLHLSNSSGDTGSTSASIKQMLPECGSRTIVIIVDLPKNNTFFFFLF